MMLSVAAAAVLLVLAAISAAPASAAYWRPCPDPPANYYFNLRIHNLSCAKGLTIVRGWDGHRVEGVRGFMCRYRNLGYERGVIRCRRERNGRVQKVQWGTGS